MKAKIVQVTPEFIGQLCKTTTDCLILSVEGVPEDARFISVYWDDNTRCFKCVFEHETFEDVPDGNVLPSETVALTSHRT